MSATAAPLHLHPQGPEGRASWCLTCEIHYVWGLGAHRVPEKPEKGGRQPVSGRERISLLESYLATLETRDGFTAAEKEQLRRVARTEIEEERLADQRRVAGVVGARSFAAARAR